MIIVKLAIFIAVIVVVIYAFRILFRKKKDPHECPRCEGKGYYERTRGREPCEKCRGTGRV